VPWPARPLRHRVRRRVRRRSPTPPRSPAPFSPARRSRFHTNGDDKDGDTDVLVIVIRGDGSGAAASAHNPFGHFDDDTFNGRSAVQRHGTIASQLARST